jgi:hypothetical protein
MSQEEAKLQRLVRSVVKKRRLPSVIGSEVELGEDSTDQPAVWIWLKIDPRSELTRSQLGQINELSRSIKREIFQKDFRRQPYVGLRTAA